MARPNIPGLEVDELPGKVLASQSRAVGPSLRPNFTMPDGRPPLQIGGPPPNTALTIRNAPNWTIPPSAGARQPFDIEMPPQAPPRPAFDAGPGNPNVGPNGSAQAQAFRASTAPAAPAAPVSMRDRIVGGLREMKAGATGPTARGLASAAVPGALGAAVGYGQRSSDLAQQPAPFVPAAAKPGDIPSDPTVTGPPVVPERRPLGFGPNNEFTRNVANTLMALTPFGAGPAAATRLPVAAASVGTPGRIRAGLDLASRGAQQFVAGAQGGATLATGQPAEPVQSEPPVTPGPLDTRSYPGPTGPTPGVVMRSGNSFSGDDIKQGFSYGGDGRPAGLTPEQGGGGLKGGGTVTTMPTIGVEGYQRQLANIRGLGPAPDSTVGQGAGGFGGGAFGLRAPAPDSGDRIRELMRGGMSARQAGAFANQEAGIAEQRRSSDQNAGVQMAGITTGANTAMRGNEVAMRGQDISAGTATRGQDMTFAANRANNRLAVMQAQRDQANKDREFGAGRNDQGFKERQDREQALQRNIEAQAPVDPATGKPDANYVRDMRSGIERSAARLGVAGPHEFSPRVEQQLMAAHGLLKTLRADAGILPWAPDKLKTIDPVDLTDLKVLPNGDRQITRKDSKAMGQVIPSRYFDTEGANRIRMFGTPTNRYDILSGQGAGQ